MLPAQQVQNELVTELLSAQVFVQELARENSELRSKLLAVQRANASPDASALQRERASDAELRQRLAHTTEALERARREEEHRASVDDERVARIRQNAEAAARRAQQAEQALATLDADFKIRLREAEDAVTSAKAHVHHLQAELDSARAALEAERDAHGRDEARARELERATRELQTQLRMSEARREADVKELADARSTVDRARKAARASEEREARLTDTVEHLRAVVARLRADSVGDAPGAGFAPSGAASSGDGGVLRALQALERSARAGLDDIAAQVRLALQHANEQARELAELHEEAGELSALAAAAAGSGVDRAPKLSTALTALRSAFDGMHREAEAAHMSAATTDAHVQNAVLSARVRQLEAEIAGVRAAAAAASSEQLRARRPAWPDGTADSAGTMPQSAPYVGHGDDRVPGDDLWRTPNGGASRVALLRVQDELERETQARLQLSGQLDAVEHELAGTRRELAACQRDLVDSRRAREAALDECSRFDRELGTERERAGTALAALHSTEDELSRCRIDVSRLEADLQRVQASLAEVQGERDGLRVSLGDARTVLSRIEAEFADARTRCSELAARAECAENDLRACAGRMHAERDDKDSWRMRCDEMARAHAALERKHAETVERTAAHEQELRAEIDKSQAFVFALQRQLADAHAAHAALEQLHDQAGQLESDERQRLAQRMAAERALVERHLQQLVADHQRLLAEAERRSHDDSAGVQVRALKQETARLDADLRVAHAALAALQEEQQRACQENARACKLLESLDARTAERDRAHQQNELRLGGTLSEMEDRLAKYEIELNDARALCNRLREQLEHARSSKRALKQQVAEQAQEHSGYVKLQADFDDLFRRYEESIGKQRETESLLDDSRPVAQLLAKVVPDGAQSLHRLQRLIDDRDSTLARTRWLESRVAELEGDRNKLRSEADELKHARESALLSAEQAREHEQQSDSLRQQLQVCEASLRRATVRLAEERTHAESAWQALAWMRTQMDSVCASLAARHHARFDVPQLTLSGGDGAAQIVGVVEGVKRAVLAVNVLIGARDAGEERYRTIVDELGSQVHGLREALTAQSDDMHQVALALGEIGSLAGAILAHEPTMRALLLDRSECACRLAHMVATRAPRLVELANDARAAHELARHSAGGLAELRESVSEQLAWIVLNNSSPAGADGSAGRNTFVDEHVRVVSIVEGLHSQAHARIASLVATLRDQEQRLRGVSEQLAAALSQNHGLRQVLHEMQASEAELRAHAEQLARANQALTETNEALGASGRELSERNAALAKSLDETTARADSLEQQQADAQRELAALRRELGEVRQVESGKVRTQLEEAQRALADAEAEIAKLRAASQMERKIELRRLLDEKMHELRRQVSEVSKQSAEYSDVLQRLVANMGDYETRVATASRQSTADSTQVAEIRTALLAQVDSLGERVRDLERQLRETTAQLEREREAASKQQQLAVGAQEELHKVEAELRMAKAANPHEDSRREMARALQSRSRTLFQRIQAASAASDTSFA